MQICSKCGTINEDNARFCESCGTKLENVKVIRETIAAGPEKPQAVREEPQQKSKKPEPERTEPSAPEHKESGPEKKQLQIKVPQINVDKLKAGGLKANRSIRELGRAAKVITAEAVLLILLLCAFFALGNTKGDPGSVVKKYFKSYVEGDWSSVYRMTDFPVSDFLTEENYISLMEAAKPDDIINFEVKEEKKKKSEKKKLIENYTIKYTVKGESEYRSMELRLIRQNEKTMLFFPTWKVSPEGMVAEDYNIYVPEGARAVLDHIPFAEGDLLPESDRIRGWDHYQVTIFSGNHELEVAAPWQEIQSKKFSTYSEDDYVAEDMEFTDEAMDAIEGTAKAAMEQIYQGALDRKSFDEVAGLFDEEYKQRNQEMYEELWSDINDREEYHLDQVTFNNFKRSLSGQNDDGSHLILTARLNYDYTSEYTRTYRSWTGQTEVELKNNKGSDEITAGFLYDGEGYKLAWLDMDSVF